MKETIKYQVFEEINDTGCKSTRRHQICVANNLANTTREAVMHCNDVKDRVLVTF